MFIKEDPNYFLQQHQKQQNKQISSVSLNSLLSLSLSIPHEQLNHDDKQKDTFHQTQIKEYSYDCEKTRSNTNSHIKHVTFQEPFIHVINVRSYKKYNKLPSLENGNNSSKKKRQPYYVFGEDNIICKCIIL